MESIDNHSASYNPNAITESSNSAVYHELPEDFHSLLDQCNIAVKAQIVGYDEFIFGAYRYKCKVIDDYFANVDYMGGEDGCIYIYETWGGMRENEVRFFFLDGKQLVNYPHIAYYAIEYRFSPKLEDGKLENWFWDEINMGLAQEDDIEELICNYVAENDITEKKIDYLPKIDSYEDMVALATDVWVIKIQDWNPTEGNTYCGLLNYKIEEVLFGDYSFKEESDKYFQELVSNELVFEEGKQYIMLRGINPRYGTHSIISKDYCFVSEQDSLFVELVEKFQ